MTHALTPYVLMIPRVPEVQCGDTRYMQQQEKGKHENQTNLFICFFLLSWFNLIHPGFRWFGQTGQSQSYGMGCFAVRIL